MAEINIVRPSEIGTFVENAIVDLNAHLWRLRKQGHDVLMPEKMEFDMVVVDRFQELEITTTERGETVEKGKTEEKGGVKEKQGGETLDTKVGKTAESETATKTSATDDADRHIQNEASTETNYE